MTESEHMDHMEIGVLQYVIHSACCCGFHLFHGGCQLRKRPRRDVLTHRFKECAHVQPRPPLNVVCLSDQTSKGTPIRVLK